jgi:hypothetical protein
MNIWRPTPGGWLRDTQSNVSRPSPGGFQLAKTEATTPAEEKSRPETYRFLHMLIR